MRAIRRWLARLFVHPSECLRIKVPPSACSVMFGPDRASIDLDGFGEIAKFKTCRAEMVIFHFNGDGALVEIELIGTGKRCQEYSEATP